MGDDEKVKYTVTLESTYTVVANPTPEQREYNTRINQAWTEANRKQQEQFHQRAAGRKLLRLSSMCGPCIVQGIVIRETAHFFIYAEGAHYGEEPIEAFPLRRKSKESTHVESCRGCEDHPQTLYPMGRLD